MIAWETRIDLGARTWAIVSSIAAVTLLAWVALLGFRARDEPQRCRPGFNPILSRCCAPGQGTSLGACVGAPLSCPEPYEMVSTPAAGCALPHERVRIPDGRVTLGPTDWDSASIIDRHTIAVDAFWMDRSEVDAFRYQKCVRAGMCEAREGELLEPGTPVVGLSAEQATRYCAFVGGRLPTPAEWVFAAAGSDARRYPWGAHGLVCRRAAFGLERGPCSEKATRPEISGMRPAGQTPDGLLDMAGNVAEMTLADGQLYLHGGSFRSRVAREMKTWSLSQHAEPDETGFRCAYDNPGTSSLAAVP